MHKKFEELIKETQFRAAFEKISKPKKGSSNKGSATSKTVMEDQYGFTISDYPANVVVSGSITSYTFLITRENTTPNVFENLIVKLNGNQEPKAYILKYESNTSFATVPYNYNTFQGVRTLEPIIYNASPVNSLLSDIECEYVSEWSCANHSEWQPGCEGHEGVGGLVCTGGGSVQIPGDGDGHAGGGGGGLPTAPVVPTITDVSGNKPCEELIKLSNNNAIKASINVLATKTQGDKEFGYAVRKLTTAPNTFAPPTTMAVNPKNPNALNIPAYLDGSWLGIEHNHPNPNTGAPMFSTADVFDGLHDLAEGATAVNPGQTINYQEFFITLTCYDVYSGINMTYAIKIKDWNVFHAFAIIPGNIAAFKKNLIKEYKELYVEANNDPNAPDGVIVPPTIDKLEKAFLKSINNNNLGIGLYQADAGLNSWNELNLDPLDKPNNPKPPIKIPCN